jgi:hypothetical protein
MHLTRSLVFGAALGSASFIALASSPASAADCFRDTECPGAQLCIDEACVPSDEPLQSCASNADCPGHDVVCSDAFCKVEGVACRNPAGTCWVRNGGGTCECLDGNGSGWSDGYNPDDPPAVLTDPELSIACSATLVEDCGDTPPALPDACAGEVQEHCEAYVAKEDMLLAVCGESVPSSPIARVGECCTNYDDAHGAAVRECVLALDADACSWEAWGACEDADGHTSEGQNAGGESDSSEVTKGCRAATGAPPSTLLVLLALAAGRRRRAGRPSR